MLTIRLILLDWLSQYNGIVNNCVWPFAVRRPETSKARAAYCKQRESMNKIFRVIYNRATQSWVAVSELTKAHKKQSSSSAKKSTSGSSANLIKSSAIALSLLSGSAAYAAETAANGLIQINSTGTATATGSDSIAIGKDSKAAGNKDSLAIGHSAQATGNDGALAIGGDSKASGKSNIALGYQAQADKDFAVAIGKGASAQKYNNAVAIGANSQANGATSLALGMGSKATGHDSYAIGYGSDAIGEQSIAFGRTSKASKKYDIVFGSEANTRDQGQGHSIAIGYGAMSGTNSAGKNLNGGDAGGVAIGTGAYTGVNKNNISLNSSVAVGAGAGAGYRKVDADGLPTDNATDADNNAKVLVKAFGGTTNTLDYFKNSGKADKEGFFSFQGVNINEATALGRNARAIGDQSVAIGAQSVAGQGSIVIGGNDIQAYDNKKYFKALNPDSKDAKGVNDFDAETTPGTGKNGNPITIRDKYKELVGTVLDNSYRSSYGQDGSTVIGMQAHSTTPLGVAIGTNSIVRKGAFGATAIGSGASVLANAEAAVAIGMGSEAQGNYAVAAGTGAKAEESAVAAGYQANADKSAVAVGDSSKAATSSVAVGQGAVSEQVSDIAIGQGAKAKGEQGAIAMGLGTIAQGHSSIMIGGSDISTAADQVVSYSREKMNKDGTPELYDGKITEVINGKTVTRTVKLVKTETVAGEKLSDAYREITGYRLSTDSLDYSSSDNKNGHASISMGIHSLSKGAMGVAIGTGARADALGSMALGTGAHASMQNSVAIGTGAVADEISKGTRQTDISYDEDGNVVETGSAKAKYTFRWAGGINTSEGDVVSFGTPGAERQLKNVAAGRVAEDSTDAVNGSQLNAITRSLSQTITNGWQVGGNNKFRLSNIGSNGRVNFLDGLGTAVNIAEINQAEDTKGNKLVKIGSDFYKASDFTDGKLNAGAQKVAAAEIKKQPAGANVTFDVKEVNSTLSVSPVGLKVTTGEVTANPDGTMKTPNNTSKANNATVTTAMNAAETALVASQKEWREKNDAYQQTESAYLAADTALTKGKEAVEAIQADIATTQQELQAAQSILATDQAALARAQADVDSTPTDTKKQSVLNKAKEKVGDSQFVVDQRTQKLAHQQATLTERQSQVSVLEQAKTNAETVRNTAKDAYDVANSDLIEKKKEFDTAKEKFVAAGANQIATVQNVADSINASGWTLQQGTSDKDLVQPGDKVAFVDGNGTTVTVTTDAEKKRSEIKFDIDKADLTTNAGKVVAPDLKELNKAVEDAQAAVNNAKDADNAGSTETTKQNLKEAEAKLATAQQAYNKENNKVATAQSVATAINDAYWIAAASGNGKNGTEDNVKAGTKVTFDAGKNIEIDHSTANKFTFKTVDSPVFTTVQIGGGKGPKITSNGDNLKVTKADGTSPTKITNVANGSDDNDAVNVSQLNASGWKVAGDSKTEVDTINPSEQVNFLDGSGTTVTVEKDKGADGNVNGNVNVKYDVKLGNGLDKDTGGNITVKPADKSITVSSDGIKVNTGKGLKIDAADGNKVAVDTDNKTITVSDDGTVKAVTGTIETVTAANKTEKAGQVRVADAEKGKLATVDTVAQAVNSAKWMAKATNTDAEIADTDKTNDKTTAEGIAAGDEVTFTAGKNLRVKRDGKNFTFATDKNVSFDSVKVGAEDTAANGKKPVSLTTSAATTADNNQTGKAPTTALNISSGTGKDAKPTQITGVGSVLKTTTVTSAPDGTTPANQPKLVNLGTAHNQTALADNVLNSAATVRDLANMGWKVSSDKVTGADDKSYSDVVRNADEVKFVGKNAAKVSGKTENGVRTITVDVEVPDVKTAKLVSSTDGSVIAPSTDSKLQDALKTAKDELAAAATPEQKEAAENKVKAAETALNNALDDKGVATAKNVADMINNSGFTLKTSAAADGKKDDKSTGSEVIKSGKAVEMVAGKNLTVKQEANGKVTYSLNPELINLTSAEFKGTGKNAPTTKLTNAGITITSATAGKQPVSLTENGLNNGGNAISNVAGNLDGAKTGTDAPTISAIKPTALTETNAATVGDVLNSGWNIRGAKQVGGEVENVDFVRTYDTVDFVSGNKATTDVTVTAKDGGKGAVVTITAKNEAGSITTAGGKVVVGANGKADTDPKAGNKVAKTGDVANAINQSGWKTNATKIDGKAATDANKTQLINPGDAVNYENGNGTVANVEVTQGKDGNPDTVSVKYDVKADNTTIKVGGDGKVTAVTGETEALSADADGKKKGQLKAKDGDGSKLATVESVANAVNSAKWYAKADNDQTATVSDMGKTTNDDGEAMGAGDELTLTAGKNLRVKRDGKNFTFATVEKPEFEGVTLKKGGNTVNIAPTANGLNFSRPAATAGGKEQPVSLSGISSGLEKFDVATPKTEGLLNLDTTKAGAVSDNTAATVGDLRGMGWVLSADKKTDNPAETYNAQVKNAEEVKFVGASGVTVSGKTDGNVRTITVGVDHQLATNNSVKPVEYTKKDGTKVYPKTVTNGGKTETKFYLNADGTGDEVPPGDVIVSVNGTNGTTSPTTLSNVKSNLPETRNTADAGNLASKSQSAPTIGTADGNVNANNAATVGDILNSGWNLKGNGNAVDFVRAYDTVNFVNGKGTTVSIETDGAESRVKVDVDTADLTASNGKISAPDLKTLEDAVNKAKADADANPTDEAKKTALAKAEADLAKEQNKGVTAQNVAKAINESGFTLKTSATAATDNLTADNTLKNDGEVINPGKTVEMVAGKNLTVKQDAGGKVTYATKDDVEFATVKIGKDEDGKKPVSLTTEAAKEASNNDVANKPATALKISSDGKPAQLVGVASVLNTSEVSTKPNGDKKADGKPAESKTEKLIDLAGTKAPVNKNAAATVGDLQNMGWVVSTKDGNGYTDVVKNADKVDFKGGNGIEVRGSTAADGTRVITVSAKEGKVTNKVEITKNDGSKVHAVIIDGKYYERDENGKPKTDTEIPAADIKAADNGGSGFVTGNTVANAINKSGWNVGLAEKAKADAAFGDSKYALDAGKPEKVNPDDNVHFANGNNTVVKAATVEEVDKDGKTVTNTYIRVDAELPISQISAVDENGNKVVKDADGNWYLSKADGTADKTQPKVDPAKVRQSASMDPENKGDRYTPLAKRSDDAALTADQKDALSKQQDQYAKDAADKIAEQLKGQPQTVIEAAQKAAAEVARVEAKDKYLKDNGLDKGIGGTVITNVAWGQKPDDAVNVDQLQNSGWNLDSKAVAGSSGKVISGNVSPSKVKMDETVNIDAGNNIEITRNGKNIGIATSMTPQFSSVSLGTGADAPTLSVDGDALNVGSKKDNKPVRITNVAPGVKEGDVTNVAQLKGVAQNLNNRIDNVDGNARAGIAQAIATAGLVQAYLPGKSMMAIGGGTYRGEAGYAIGYSSISDGGNWIIKGTASGNSRGHFGASASVGYQW